MNMVRDEDAAIPRDDPEEWKKLTHSLPLPPDAADGRDLLWQELSAQVRWYDRAATRNRLSYLTFKVAALIIGASVTVLAAVSAPAVLTAALAAAIVVEEGVQQVFRFHSNWISYRATAETLRQHAFLYAANVDPYVDPQTRRDRLADVVRNVAAKENASWTVVMQQSAPTQGSATA
jgi:hypothetical protein